MTRFLLCVLKDTQLQDSDGFASYKTICCVYRLWVMTRTGEFVSPVDMTCSCHVLVITVKDK